MSELKACPFCGSEVFRIGGDGDEAHDIECVGCMYTFYDVSTGNNWWNTRPIEDELQAKLTARIQVVGSLRITEMQMTGIIKALQDENARLRELLSNEVEQRR